MLSKKWHLSLAGCGWSCIGRVGSSLPLMVSLSEGSAEPGSVAAEPCPFQEGYYVYFCFTGVLSCSFSPWPVLCWNLISWALPTEFTDRKHWDTESLKQKAVACVLKLTVPVGPSLLREHHGIFLNGSLRSLFSALFLILPLEFPKSRSTWRKAKAWCQNTFWMRLWQLGKCTACLPVRLFSLWHRLCLCWQILKAHWENLPEVVFMKEREILILWNLQPFAFGCDPSVHLSKPATFLEEVETASCASCLEGKESSAVRAQESCLGFAKVSCEMLDKPTAHIHPSSPPQL